ncbi:hypothetical protein, partial [Phytoactinopolyspora endophytica]|uniref:hypothetical protein n=1 Tax=Phytoactinopolyspora endophytica TaxID=1642495 RepID=UPI0013EDD62A
MSQSAHSVRGQASTVQDVAADVEFDAALNGTVALSIDGLSANAAVYTRAPGVDRDPQRRQRLI